MGYIRHNAIVVTSWDRQRIIAAEIAADDIGLYSVRQKGEGINGYCSLLVCPDGSKEGWPDSQKGDGQRERFIEWLNGKRYEDNSTSLEWVEISYGSDDREARVVRHAWSEPEKTKEQQSKESSTGRRE